MTAILYRAPAGVAGDITRPDDTIVESGLLSTENAPAAFGVAVKVTSGGKFQAMAAGDTAADFYGILTRVAPSIAGDLAQGFDDGTPNVAAPQGIAVKGYVCVKCAEGTPERGAKVFARAVGGVFSFCASSGSGQIEVPDAIWASGGKDENGLAEIRIG